MHFLSDVCSYFAESFYSPSVLAQAVEIVKEDGGHYFASVSSRPGASAVLAACFKARLLLLDRRATDRQTSHHKLCSVLCYIPHLCAVMTKRRQIGQETRMRLRPTGWLPHQACKTDRDWSCGTTLGAPRTQYTLSRSHSSILLCFRCVRTTPAAV